MKLELGGPQAAVLAVFLAVVLAFAALFVVVGLASSFDVGLERVRSVGYAIRRPWFIFLVALVVITLSTLAFWLPYASGGKPATEVRVVGGQFYWSLSPDRFRAGERVRFDVTSVDVNHGFGLYDPDGRLIGSVQAMPGYLSSTAFLIA